MVNRYIQENRLVDKYDLVVPQATLFGTGHWFGQSHKKPCSALIEWCFITYGIIIMANYISNAGGAWQI